jgi:hypothetical protein
MTVYVADAHVHRLVSEVKTATMLEECITEERRSFVLFFFFFGGQKNPKQRIFMKKRFLFKVGIICHVKQFTTGWQFADEEVETEVQKWLRQQSKHLFVVGFDALVKRWDKCINVGGGYVVK